MPREAHNQATHDTLDTTGLEDFFSCHDKTSQQDLTLEEASVRLNLSERTIQRRLKQGQLKGYKIPGPRGPEWRIQIEATEDMPSVSVDKTEAGLVTTVINPVSSQGKTESENTISAPLSEVFEFYKEQIDLLHDKLEAATYRNGYLEAQLAVAADELKLLPDLSAKATRVEQLEQQLSEVRAKLETAERRGWLQRFGKWFIGAK